MLLNALPNSASRAIIPTMILLAIEDATERDSGRTLLESVRAALSPSVRVRPGRHFDSRCRKSMRIIDANPFMQELLGYTREQFLGKGALGDRLFSGQTGKLDRDAEVAGDRLRPLRRPALGRPRAGKIREVELICNVYQEDGGHRRPMQYPRHLGAKAGLERTMLEQIRTQEQAKILADTNRRKDEFLAMLSHELRNPMAPIFNAAATDRAGRRRNRFATSKPAASSNGRCGICPD